MLPELPADSRVPGSLIGALLYAGHEVSLRLTPDDASTHECLSSAARAVSALPEIDTKAKDTAARDLLANYNQNWRHYSQVAEDGAIVERHDPALGPSDFKGRLRMTCLEVVGVDRYTIFYDDDHMFWGHSVVITAFDGLRFSDTHSELFG